MGKTYIGESAGSVILSPNIEYISDMDNPKLATKLTCYDALDVIDFYPLPHYTNFPFKDAAETVFSTFEAKIKICTFSNNQAILINGKNINVKTTQKQVTC